VPLNGGLPVLVLDTLLRSLVTAVLALAVTAAAIYEILDQHRYESPLVNWAGIIIGTYFGSVIATRGEDRRRRIDQQGGARG